MTDNQTIRISKQKEILDAEVEMISELVNPLGLKVEQQRDANGFPGKAVASRIARQYTLLGPGSEHGEIKILGADTPMSVIELKQYVLRQLNISKN